VDRDHAASGTFVRVSDGHVESGYTPEILEFHQSAEPVQLRFELDGYFLSCASVSALSDGELKVVLEPLPKGRHPATKKSKGSKEHKNPTKSIAVVPRKQRSHSATDCRTERASWGIQGSDDAGPASRAVTGKRRVLGAIAVCR